MTLRLEQIIHDIERMSAALGAGDRRRWLDEARRLLRTYDRGLLERKLEPYWRAGGASMLVGEPMGDLDERRPAPAAPANYTAVAADGSNIPPDHDGPGRFYLLNMGMVGFGYGDASSATIASQAQLYYRPEELYWDEARRQPMDPTRLSHLMRVEEIAALPDLAEQVEGPCVALVDGQLTMWGLQGEAEDRWGLMERLADAMDRLRDLRVPIVGYISDTQSFELVNALRVYLCPASPDNCQQCHARGPAELALCYHLNGFRDPALLFDFLEAGERSCCFESHAKILDRYTDPLHRTAYFFLSTGDEIARVEVPRWVAEDAALLDLVHGVLHDQNRRSGQQPPYPPTLHEAHEAAVISVADRACVQMLVEEQLERYGMPPFRPAKAFHKRMRGV